MVGVARIELATSWSQTKRAAAALHPASGESSNAFRGSQKDRTRIHPRLAAALFAGLRSVVSDIRPALSEEVFEVLDEFLRIRHLGGPYRCPG